MREVHVLNLGAGVQSTALALLSIAKIFPERIPVFDCAIFADVGEEPAAVYSHLGWLAAKCAPFFHDNAEWLRMKSADPESWARAVEIDRAIRDHDSTCARAHGERLYLHRSCLPLDHVDFTLPDPLPHQQDLNFSAFECEGMCGL